MSRDPVSALEEFDVRTIEGDLAQRLDAGATVLTSLIAGAVGAITQGAVLDARDREDAEEAAREWAFDQGLGSFYDTFSGGRVVTCGNPGGLYELWGLDALELAGKGYIFDWGEDSERARVRATWSPTDGEQAFEQAVIRAWAETWMEIGLPPLLGDCWQGDGPLVYRALESLLSDSEEARDSFRDRLSRLGDKAITPDWGLFQLSPSDSGWITGEPVVAEAVEDATKRSALVAMYLTSTHGCP